METNPWCDLKRWEACEVWKHSLCHKDFCQFIVCLKYFYVQKFSCVHAHVLKRGFVQRSMVLFVKTEDSSIILSKWTGRLAVVQRLNSEVKEQTEESTLSLADQTCLYTSSNFKDGSNPLSAPSSEGLFCELPESLLSSQVFKLAKAAFIVHWNQLFG